MKERESEVQQRKRRLIELCSSASALSLPMVQYVGARLSQHEVTQLSRLLKENGLSAEVTSKGHNVSISPKER